jgi:hypothetical protein
VFNPHARRKGCQEKNAAFATEAFCTGELELGEFQMNYEEGHIAAASCPSIK